MKKHVQNFRYSLNDTKMTLAMIIISKQPQGDSPLSVADLKSESRNVVPPNLANSASLLPDIKEWIQQSVLMGFEDLVASGTIEKLQGNAGDRVTEFKTQTFGAYKRDGNCIQQAPMVRSSRHQKQSDAKFPRTSRIYHRTRSLGVLFGRIWVRTSTLRLAAESATAGGDVQMITSFTFYPSSWLTRTRLGRGVEASLRSTREGFKFDFNLNPIRAVPNNSTIFQLCRTGDWKAVQKLIQWQQASLRDMDSRGWTPLHVSHPHTFIPSDLTLVLVRRRSRPR